MVYTSQNRCVTMLSCTLITLTCCTIVFSNSIFAIVSIRDVVLNFKPPSHLSTKILASSSNVKKLNTYVISPRGVVEGKKTTAFRDYLILHQFLPQ
jgi:hypothetical protein